MKILITGGGTGGHFYPSIAVAHAIREIVREQRLLEPRIIYMGPRPYDERMLFEEDVEFSKVTAGKRRLYFSLLNVLDVFRMGLGIIKATWKVFSIFPDVIFGKGGYAAFPALLAGRFFRIPIVIHESDTVPGRVNRWAGAFAKRIAISWDMTSEFFPPEKTALTGNPIRHELAFPAREGAREFLKLELDTPVLLVVGGSQGAQIINENILEALPQLLKKYQVIHQTGTKNVDDVNASAGVILEGHPGKGRYHTFGYLDLLAMRMASGAADLVISRAGASAIAEISAWGIPSIVVPISDSHADHQRKNAYSYARSGAATVLEEVNMTPAIIANEVDRILSSESVRSEMSAAAKAFSKPDAARKIAEAILQIALEHEK